jgi:NAD(P)-dependent dehydrogenase (short-subunit alcohol dehydrogenase family)
MNEFNGKVALITGAGRGIGRVIAETFAVHGAKVAINDITPINLNHTLAEVRANQGEVRDYVVDISKKMSIQAMINNILDEWGQIDFLINSANVSPQVSLLDMDEWDWRRTLDVNLTAVFFCMQSVGRVMRHQGGGAIVNLGSNISDMRNLMNRSAYQASEMGLVGLTHGAAREFAEYNIRVNLIWPGISEMETITQPHQRSEEFRRCLDDIRTNRTGIKHEVASLALYLCSSLSNDITGQIFNIDGRLNL